MTLMGRLKPGVTVAQARDDANRVAPDIYFSVRFPETRGRYKGDLIPASSRSMSPANCTVHSYHCGAAVGIILLIACVNLSNLLLARASARAASSPSAAHSAPAAAASCASFFWKVSFSPARERSAGWGLPWCCSRGWRTRRRSRFPC